MGCATVGTVAACRVQRGGDAHEAQQLGGARRRRRRAGARRRLCRRRDEGGGAPEEEAGGSLVCLFALRLPASELALGSAVRCRGVSVGARTSHCFARGRSALIAARLSQPRLRACHWPAAAALHRARARVCWRGGARARVVEGGHPEPRRHAAQGTLCVWPREWPSARRSRAAMQRPPVRSCTVLHPPAVP